MGFVRSIVNVKYSLFDREIMCIFLVYVKNHTGSKYRMLNICAENIVLRNDIRLTNKQFGEYISRK